MSVWGGIGEGIAQGLSERMAREDRLRREDLAQSNWQKHFDLRRKELDRRQQETDQEFQFKREQAERAQANADRTFTEGVRRADMAQANADREYGLRQDELALKGVAQEWDAALNNEKLRGLQIANEKLDIELRKKRREEEIQQNTGADQFVLATSRMLDGTLGNKGKWQFGIDDGTQQDLEGTLVEGDGFYQIFGKDSPLVKQGFYGIFMQDDENGEPNFVFLNSNPQANIVKTPEQMYEMYKGQYNEGLANRYFGKAAQRKDLGMLREQENIKADARIREVRESGRGIGAASTAYQTGLNNIDELIPLPMKGEADYDAKLKEAESKRAQFRDGYMKLLGSIGVENAYAGGLTGERGSTVKRASKIEVPSNTYKVIGPKGSVAGIRKGSVRMQNGRVLAPGESVDTPEGTLVNENGKVYLISK